MTTERAPDPPALSIEQITQIAAVVYALIQGNTPIDPELRLYNAKQSAELLGKSEWWIQDQARKGLIPCTRVGRTVHLSAAQIREIRARGEVDPATRRRPGRAPKRQATAA